MIQVRKLGAEKVDSALNKQVKLQGQCGSED